MTTSLFVPGRLPGMNEIVKSAKGYGGRGYGYAKLKREWTETVAILARAQKLTPMERGRFRFEWFEPKPGKRFKLRDPDNVAAGGRKVILDGLVEAGVIPDDSWGVVLGWDDRFSVGAKVGCLVTLEPAA